MTVYEYKVIPAPVRGTKAKGLKTPAERFARTLEELMTEQGAQGWEYLRAEALPCEERSGLRKKVTTYQNILVFRRAIETLENVSDVTRPDPALGAAAMPGILSAPAPGFAGISETEPQIAAKAPSLPSPVASAANDKPADPPLTASTNEVQSAADDADEALRDALSLDDEAERRG